MSKIALTLPWTSTPLNPATTTPINPSANPASKFPASGFHLADALNVFADVAIVVGAFLMFFWMAWGVFDYIRAEGNKESLAKARKRIQWAIAGFVILLLSFYLSEFISEYLFNNNPSGTRGIPLQRLSRP